eukprot:6180068-Pleurochrysis_carterae.AAC.3
MANALDVSSTQDACQSNEKGKVLTDPPLPALYVKVALAVEEDGTAVLIVSPLAVEGQTERKSVDTPLPSAEPPPSTTSPGQTDNEPCAALHEGTVWIEEIELLRAMRLTPLRITKSTSQRHWASVGKGRGGTTIRRSVAENLEDLSYRPDAARRLRRRDQADGEGYPCQVYVYASSGTAWRAEQSFTPKHTCSRGWMCPSASANLTTSKRVAKPERGRRQRR